MINSLRLALASTLVVGMLAAVIGVLGFSGPPPLSAQTGTGEQLTAQFSNVPTFHDGTELTFGLTFTPEPELSYVTLRDHAFTVTNAAITKAQARRAGQQCGMDHHGRARPRLRREPRRGNHHRAPAHQRLHRPDGDLHVRRPAAVQQNRGHDSGLDQWAQPSR